MAIEYAATGWSYRDPSWSRARNTARGPSRAEPRMWACCPRWAGSAPASTTPWWSRSGAVSRRVDRQPGPRAWSWPPVLFGYLEIFHNRQRRHSSLGMLTPFEFESRQGAAATSTVAWGQFRASTQLRAPQTLHDTRGCSRFPSTVKYWRSSSPDFSKSPPIRWT